LRGSAPNIFMSRAESHEVGGGKAAKEEGGEGGGGLEDRVLNERGAGDGVGECLSLRRMAMMKQGERVKENHLNLDRLRNIRPSLLFSPYF
jgi:hypothetical protein